MRLESTLPAELESLIRQVIGAAIEVHRQLGPGFIEGVYEQVLCYEFATRALRYVRQKEIKISDKEIKLVGQRLDMLVEDQLIVELKAVE